MDSLFERRIVLGVSGGIAAYKAIEVCRILMGAGAHVLPVMTSGAQRFVGPTTLSTLASEPVRSSLWDSPEPIPHTALGRSADLILVVPATARLIGNYAAGISNDLLTATLLATTAPVLVCPAMHTEMWEHPAVIENVAKLKARGVTVVDPESGPLAGGDSGPGRLASPSVIVARAADVLAGRSGPLRGLTALVTAGGTREPVDPVRFLGNRSSGRQGHALASALSAHGAEVTLVTTADIELPTGVRIIRVDTSTEMEAELAQGGPSSDILVMAAAVADFRPKVASQKKLKKGGGVPELVLEETPDLVKAMARSRRPGQTIVAFAAETIGRSVGEEGDCKLEALAREKLTSKGVDMVVANDVSLKEVGFGYRTNSVVMVRPDQPARRVPLTDKHEVASEIVGEIVRIRASMAEEEDA